jgi:hypothetical protein
MGPVPDSINCEAWLVISVDFPGPDMFFRGIGSSGNAPKVSSSMDRGLGITSLGHGSGVGFHILRTPRYANMGLGKVHSIGNSVGHGSDAEMCGFRALTHRLAKVY